MNTPINYFASEINVTSASGEAGNINTINQGNVLAVKPRPHIVATRAARQARRASRYGL